MVSLKKYAKSFLLSETEIDAWDSIPPIIVIIVRNLLTGNKVGPIYCAMIVHNLLSIIDLHQRSCSGSCNVTYDCVVCKYLTCFLLYVDISNPTFC